MTNDLTITLPTPLADDIRAAAEARGLTPEEFVRLHIAEDIEAEREIAGELDWEEDERRMLEPGENISLDDAFDRLEATIAAKHPGAK